MKLHKELKKILKIYKSHNPTLIRNKNHQIWKLNTGKIVVVPKTPSDYRAWKNVARDFKKAAA